MPKGEGAQGENWEGEAFLALAAVTKYHRLGDIGDKKHLFLIDLEAGSPRSWCQQIRCLVACFLACNSHPLAVSLYS